MNTTSQVPAPATGEVAGGGAASRWVDELSLGECWELLSQATVSRLAVDVGGQPDIFPINHVVDGSTVVFRTGAGTKLAGAVLGRFVALEIDGADPDDRSVWSVVVKGTAHEVDHIAEGYRAEQLPLYPWTAEPKPNFVRIVPELVTGRRFHVVAAADLDEYCQLVAGRRPAARPAALAVLPEPGREHHPGAPQLRPD